MAETREFQAETRKLLDIVTNSIYTDKEVFLRELISNASDALEKFRYKQVLGEVTVDGSDESANSLGISITADKEKKTITIVDNGIGMTKEELIGNLGTIARSGSKQFVESLKEKGSGKDGDGIIGQFGVGFYSSFMVAETVAVESSSALSGVERAESKWSSDGSGVYTIEDTTGASDIKRGSKITLNLKESCVDFADADKIKSIIKKYSNFVAFPIKVNEEVVNTQTALWLQDKKGVTEKQYREFYQYVANTYDEPKYTLHFRVDAPLDLKVLFFVPSMHTEKFGMGRMDPGVNMYSRKVLIETRPKDLLPEWLRFVKGVVDSEDLPLSLSREKPQDSNLLRRIRDVLVRKVLRFLEEQAKDDPKKYQEFYIEYNYFLKEGVCHDYKYMDQLSKLLLFESSSLEDGMVCSLDDYISRCPPEQKDIYYLVAPSRKAALKSPYYETFKKHNKEVLLLYSSIDDFVMSNIKTFSGRTLTSAETSSINLDENKDTDADDGKGDNLAKTKLTDVEAEELCSWLESVLGTSRVRKVKTTARLSDSPALVTDHESGALRRMMKMVDQSNQGKQSDCPPQMLEINPKHPMILGLFAAKGSSEEVAKLVAEQLFDNTLVAAGLLDDPRSMIPRLNDILTKTLQK